MYWERQKLRLIDRINKWLLKKSWKAADEKAKSISGGTGKKVYVFLWDGNFEAMPKQDFKRMWHNRPGMKKRTLEQWKKYVHEY